MPIFEEEGRLTREDLLELRRRNRCKECGGRLDVFMDFTTGKAFLACTDFRRTHHEGIEREASRYEQQGLEVFNIPTRRKIMTEDLGPEKTRALSKYLGAVSLTREEAREILVTVFPDAPDLEITRAMILCAGYGLNPLMKHVFLIPFNKGKPNETWATVVGIKAKRLLASRPDIRGRPRPYSYVDSTPRVMTEEEQKTTFGEVYKDRLYVITKGRDPQSGAEAVGYGFWLHKDTVYGTDKGNSEFNMASVRSESQMLDRLRPGEMPMGVGVIDETYTAPPLISHSEGGAKVGAAENVKTEEDKSVIEGEAKMVTGEGREKKATTFAPPTEGAKNSEMSAEGKKADEVTEDDIPDLNALCRVCFHYWKLQPAQVWKELGYNSMMEVAEPAWECWLKIKAVKTGQPGE